MRRTREIPGLPHRAHGWRTGLSACALLLAAPFAAVASVSQAHSPQLNSAAQATTSATTTGAASALDGPGGQVPVVNWALSGTASATSVLPGYPASSAVDGDAGTSWCTWGWTGTLTVDLGQARALDDLGITLDASSPSASATIELAATSGDWQSVPGQSNVALDPGSPMYLPLPKNTTARYAEITVYSGTGANVCVGELRAYGPDPAKAGMALGADLSFTPQELAAGARFSYSGQPATPVQIMREAGANYVRIRLWLDPPAGYSDLASDLALARQARASGMKIYLDIMYSDFWADPTKQNIPAAWQGQDLAQLTSTVRSYTQGVIAAFARHGTPADMVSIGNEIRNGILWPAGEVNCTDCGGWASFTQLLKAGVAGAQAGNPRGHRLLIMMHYDLGADFTGSSAFYSQLQSSGVPFDVIGLSYYPVLSEPSISQFKANVDGLASEFGKPIVLAETQYPWTLANGNSPLGDSTGDFAWEASQIEPGYPATPGGQLSFVTDELSILAQAPGGLGMGLFYWAPDWIPGVPWEPGAGIGSPNVNMTLFNFEGQALPSISIFRNPAQVCERETPDITPCVIGG
jgi:arabinogalactan endo-1,4-beta-galactosidase